MKVKTKARVQRGYRRFAAEGEALGDAAAALYAAGGTSATVEAVRDAVQFTSRRGGYGDGEAAAARAARAFTAAQTLLHGGRGLEEEDRMEAPWATMGRPPDDAWWGQAASRV